MHEEEHRHYASPDGDGEDGDKVDKVSKSMDAYTGYDKLEDVRYNRECGHGLHTEVVGHPALC